MFNLPIPFKERGALKTWLHSEGFELECDCASPVRIVGDGISISGVTIDLTSLETRLDSILTELEIQNDPLTQTIITGTTAGSIPAGVQSYAIFNLGVNPNDPSSTVNPMVINGIPINERYISFSNSNGSVKALDNAITYDPNGNTLLIVYNT